MEHSRLLCNTEARLTAHRRWLLVLLAAATVAAPGCRKAAPKPAATAEAAAQQFVAVVQAGEFERAARMMDYESTARSQNENWEDIPPGQRDQIIAKLRGDQATILRQTHAKYGADLKVAGSVPAADSTLVTLTGTGGDLPLYVVQTAQGWRVRASF